ncbi:hypothetical protein EBF04_29805 [Streptomyces sp. I6]|nr:hypothetical protein EBF04_29805 [Streptomyces sp. I6]
MASRSFRPSVTPATLIRSLRWLASPPISRDSALLCRMTPPASSVTAIATELLPMTSMSWSVEGALVMVISRS